MQCVTVFTEFPSLGSTTCQAQEKHRDERQVHRGVKVYAESADGLVVGVFAGLAARFDRTGSGAQFLAHDIHVARSFNAQSHGIRSDPDNRNGDVFTYENFFARLP